MSDLKFSVAISVYKNDNSIFFERALKSITDDQTLKPNEIVLVVDGAVSQEIDGVINDFSIKYPNLFKVIRLEKNGGLGNALRIAVENSSFEIIARMDSDDVSSPERFKRQINYLKENPDVDIMGGDISEFIDSEENVVAYRKVPVGDEKIKKYMKKRCPFNHVTVAFKKSAVLKAGGYLDFFWNEDYYLWIRMFESGAVFANSGNVLVNVRTGKDMYKRRGGLKYYKSEKALQKYMLKHKIIGFGTYFVNVTKRFIVQVLMPNGIRGWVFKKFARKSA